MARAIFNGTVIAESPSTEMVEGNHYFPRSSVDMQYFSKTDHSTVCPWKGDASYFTIEVDGVSKANIAWTYEMPKDKAAHIKDHIAFYPDVTVEA